MMNHLCRLLVRFLVMGSLVFVGATRLVSADRVDAISVSSTLVLTPEEFMKVRCSVSGEAAYFGWDGKVFAQLPGERQRLLFNVLGMSINGCYPLGGGPWGITTRELMVFSDPMTGKILDHWSNPWTNEIVPVVHVANDPVQFRVSEGVPYHNWSGRGEISLNIPLTFPNPLAKDPKFQSFGGNDPWYQAFESFTWNFKVDDLPRASNVPGVFGTWSRIGPFLPFMKMGEKNGVLFYSVQMRKLNGNEEVDPSLTALIRQRLPNFEVTPNCWEEAGNQSSTSYFIANFDAYLAGANFPVSASLRQVACQAPAPNLTGVRP